MDETDDQMQFFEDLAATARQSVEQVRGVEENLYAAVQGDFTAAMACRCE